MPENDTETPERVAEVATPVATEEPEPAQETGSVVRTYGQKPRIIHRCCC
jgi:hypothetical protein